MVAFSPWKEMANTCRNSPINSEWALWRACGRISRCVTQMLVNDGCDVVRARCIVVLDLMPATGAVRNDQ